jgi:hypothetical protein
MILDAERYEEAQDSFAEILVILNSLQQQIK